MLKHFSIDSSLPNAHIEISKYLLNKLKPILKSKLPIIFVCIGTDRFTEDSLGTLVGYKLKIFSKNNIYIYSSLESPIHSKNLSYTLSEILFKSNNSYIIALIHAW